MVCGLNKKSKDSITNKSYQANMRHHLSELKQRLNIGNDKSQWNIIIIICYNLLNLIIKKLLYGK